MSECTACNCSKCRKSREEQPHGQTCRRCGTPMWPSGYIHCDDCKEILRKKRNTRNVGI